MKASFNILDLVMCEIQLNTHTHTHTHTHTFSNVAYLLDIKSLVRPGRPFSFVCFLKTTLGEGARGVLSLSVHPSKYYCL